MMRRFRHVFREFRKHPGKYLPIYIQLIVSVLVFSLVISVMGKENHFVQQMERLVAHGNMYIANDRTGVSIMNELSSEDAEERCKELYDFINEQVTVYIHQSSAIGYPGWEILFQEINYNFAQLYGLHVSEGREITEEEYSDDGRENVPVLVGINQAKEYPVGTVIQYPLGSAQSEPDTSFEVVGVLVENSFYLDPSVRTETLSLDDSFVIPWRPNLFGRGYTNINLFHLLQVETDTPEFLDKIAAKSKELGLFDFEFVSVREKILQTGEYYAKIYARDSAILAVLLLFCAAGCITMLLQYVKTHVRHNAVHMLCGASQNDVNLQMLIQISVPLFIGVIITWFLFRDLMVTGVSAFFCLGLAVILWAVPAFVWRRMTISQIYKRFE